MTPKLFQPQWWTEIDHEYQAVRVIYRARVFVHVSTGRVDLRLIGAVRYVPRSTIEELSAEPGLLRGYLMRLHDEMSLAALTEDR